jgi:succinylarginine dihydrolase
MEMNFDGLAGPTHNYGGLSYGDLASMEHRHFVSYPKKAALQGLEKMHLLTSLGIKQAVLPPQERPFFPILRALGFYGSDSAVLEQVWKVAPCLLIACSSSACMWAANAATVSPSADSQDGRVHFTPANLINEFHRSFEMATTGRVLHQIFNHPLHFAHHFPLPLQAQFADEGAANHTRFCREFHEGGIQFFVFDRPAVKTGTLLPRVFPARQTEAASQAIARLHRLRPSHVVFAQQNPDAVDAGVFHNDVISVGHQNLFLYHERAFVNSSTIIQQLRELVEKHCQVPLCAIEVKETEISLSEAVKTYMFNSQIVTLPDQTMVLIAPQECEISLPVRSLFQRLIEDKQIPIQQVIYQDIGESMRNGGGPGCLRLRVVLTDPEYAAMHHEVELTDQLYDRLVSWINKYYRDRLLPDDLADPQLLEEGHRALDDLSGILQLGPIYSFQQQHAPPPLPPRR